MSYLLGIDLGSTSLKAVAFDLEGNVKAIGTRPTHEFHPDIERPERSVWMPDDIWEGTAGAIRDVTAHIEDASQIAAVAVTGMGMDGLPISEDGRWLYPFISHRDNRTFPQHQWWLDTLGPGRIYQITGHAPLHINSVNRIMWMQEHEPELLSQAQTWLLIEDFVNFMLCGVRATDYTMAATTQLLDIARLDWSEELIEASGIDHHLLPPLLASGTVLGEVQPAAAKQTGLLQGTPVVLGGHDYLMGALAAGAMEPDTLIDITGTWEIMMSLADEPILTEEVRETCSVWDPHVIKGKYCLFVDVVAGNMIEWYRSQFGQVAEEKAAQTGRLVWEVLMEEAATVGVGSGGVTFLPHLSGSSCPVKDARSHGAFIGISHFSSRGMFTRAVIEGLNYQTRQMLESIETVVGRQAQLRAIGGAVRNSFWMQNKADVLGRTILTTDLEEATCLGTAMIAGIGVGLYQDEADAFKKCYRPGCAYQPVPSSIETYTELYHQVYLPLYTALKPVHHTIYERFRQ